ncbi:MAG: hypothetical protein MJ240_02210 [Kiritimatiellae bacterium]|nr:hypothetical protein [Kiritimatiellia bacterium]
MESFRFAIGRCVRHSLVGLVAVGLSWGLWAAEAVNLLQAPVCFRGSSFRATPKYVATVTTNYYTMVADGKPSTHWEPLEEKGPHFLEMIWQQPVRIHTAKWQTEGVKQAKLSRWTKGTWQPVVPVVGARGESTFPEAESARWRLDLTEAVGVPKIFELEMLGPEQYLLPQKIGRGRGRGEVTFSRVQLPDAPLHPGDRVTVSFSVAAAPNTVPYGLMIELSDRDALEDENVPYGSILGGGSDYASGRWDARPDAQGRVSVEMELPPWTPHGRSDLLITALADGSNQIIAMPKRVLGSVDVERPDFPEMLPPVHEVKIGDNAAGQRGFIINGNWHPAFFNRFYGHPDPERIAAFGENGLKILYWQNRDVFPLETEEEMDRRIRWFDRRIRMALRVNPRNYFILSQRAKASPQWCDRHPEELMRLANGQVNPEKLVSFGSELYLRQAEAFAARLVRFVARQPYAGRVIGYHYWTCTKNDGFIGGTRGNRKITRREDFVFGDYHPGALQLFRAFLRRKYANDVAKLRAAWQNGLVDFDTARVEPAEILREDFPKGAFRDPARTQSVRDYLEFFPSMLSRWLSRTGAVFKRESGNKALVLAHYGAVKSYLSASWGEQLHSSNSDFESVLDDPNIDAFVQAQPYNTREAGCSMQVYQPLKDVELHGKLFLFDHDHRTLGSGYLRHGRHRSQHESAAVYARDFAHQWIRNAGAWISDMSISPWSSFEQERLPWYTMPEVVTPIRDTLRALQTLQTKRQNVAEIAVVTSLNSPRYEDVNRMNPHYKGLVTELMLREGLPLLGAPYDELLSGDLCRPNLPDYKLYIFVNPTYFTTAEREAIARLKGRGRTLAWFHAPGYATDQGLSVEAASRLCGIDLKIKKGVCEIPEFTFDVPETPLGRGLGGQLLTTTTWGGLDKTFAPREMSPVFYADDASAQPSGHYADGKVAYCAKDMGDWRSVWCGVPNYSLAALVNLARFAGVHLYASAPIVLAADNRLLMVHNGYDGRRTETIRLPKPARVTDLFTGAPVAKGASFELTLESPQTRLLRLDYEGY